MKARQLSKRHVMLIEERKPVRQYRPIVVNERSKPRWRIYLENTVMMGVVFGLMEYCFYYASTIPLELIRY